MAQRRTEVAESHAKSDLRRLLWLALFAAVIGGVIWLLTSPLLSVREIVTYGARHSDVAGILEREQVVEGRPLVAIRSADVAKRLEEDPWVSAASVSLVFPNLVEVTVSERTSVAWIDVGGSWALVADDGVVVAYAGQPPADAPIVRLAAGDPGLGNPLDAAAAVGAVEFVSALPANLAAGTVVRDDAGEVWATVGGRSVRLGSATDMAAKASAVAAVIELTEEGVIDVIAPSRPAVWDSDQESPDIEAQVEGET